MKILMIEDDIASQLLLKHRIDDDTIKIKCVEELKDAYTTLQNYTVNLIILDLHLLFEDQKETVPAILNLKSFAPVIVVSGMIDNLTSNKIEKECLKNGALACISKNDFNKENLMKYVFNLVKEQ